MAADVHLADDVVDLIHRKFLPDVPDVLGENARATTPGGRVVLAVYGAPTQVEFLAFFLGAMQAVVPGFTGPPPELQPSHAERLHAAMTEAGLDDVRVEAVVDRIAFRSGQQLWDLVTRSDLVPRVALANLTEQQAADVRLVLDGMLRERSDGRGAAALTSVVYVGIGFSGPRLPGGVGRGSGQDAP